MYKDPIVEEIHQARALILAQHEGKFEVYFASLMQTQRDSQRAHPERYVSFELHNLANQVGSDALNMPKLGGKHTAR
jgi:hypothetical protein